MLAKLEYEAIHPGFSANRFEGLALLKQLVHGH
jgi:hypothetical protein